MAAHTDQRTAHHPPLARLNVQGRDVASGPHRFVPFTDPGSLSEARNGTIYVPLVEVIAAPHPTFYYPDGDISFIVGTFSAYTVPNNSTALTDLCTGEKYRVQSPLCCSQNQSARSVSLCPRLSVWTDTGIS